jgi:hypothetical protein
MRSDSHLPFLASRLLGETLKLTFRIVVPPKIGHRATRPVWNQLLNVAPSRGTDSSSWPALPASSRSDDLNERFSHPRRPSQHTVSKALYPRWKQNGHRTLAEASRALVEAVALEVGHRYG